MKYLINASIIGILPVTLFTAHGVIYTGVVSVILALYNARK